MHSQPVPSPEVRQPSPTGSAKHNTPAPQPAAGTSAASEAIPGDAPAPGHTRTWKQRIAAVREAMFFWVMSRR